jgi:hypothetical protein
MQHFVESQTGIDHPNDKIIHQLSSTRAILIHQTV